jgi:hypothetical protein
VAETILTAELKRFIAGYISSLEHLEILLLLAGSPQQEWTVASVYDVVKSSDTGVQKALDELAEIKLIRREGTNYRYAPASPEISNLVADLAGAYKTRRIRVVELIYSPELDALREFQRAFRFRKKEE